MKLVRRQPALGQTPSFTHSSGSRGDFALSIPVYVFLISVLSRLSSTGIDSLDFAQRATGKNASSNSCEGPYPNNHVWRKQQLLLGSGAHLDVLVSKQILHQRPVHSRHPSVVDGKAVRQKVLQLQVLRQKHNQREGY